MIKILILVLLFRVQAAAEIFISCNQEQIINFNNKQLETPQNQNDSDFIFPKHFSTEMNSCLTGLHNLLLSQERGNSDWKTIKGFLSFGTSLMTLKSLFQGSIYFSHSIRFKYGTAKLALEAAENLEMIINKYGDKSHLNEREATEIHETINRGFLGNRLETNEPELYKKLVRHFYDYLEDCRKPDDSLPSGTYTNDRHSRVIETIKKFRQELLDYSRRGFEDKPFHPFNSNKANEIGLNYQKEMSKQMKIATGNIFLNILLNIYNPRLMDVFLRRNGINFGEPLTPEDLEVISPENFCSTFIKSSHEDKKIFFASFINNSICVSKEAVQVLRSKSNTHRTGRISENRNNPRGRFIQ